MRYTEADQHQRHLPLASSGAMSRIRSFTLVALIALALVAPFCRAGTCPSYEDIAEDSAKNLSPDAYQGYWYGGFLAARELAH